jgi:hypothetical protein
MRQALKMCCFLAGLALPLGMAAAAPPSTATKADAPVVEPQAMDALKKMGAYLRTLNAFEIKANTLTDTVLDNGQTVQFAGTANYRVRKPNGFVITVASDRKVRQFNYDGKSFTIFSPRMGFYATVPAPPTIREVLTKIHEKLGVELPLEDLFRWGLPEDRHDDLLSGVLVGYAKINGVDSDQYAFREGDVDWQIWIQRGDKPLPLKVVITLNSDPARPQFAASLNWNTNPTFTDATFAFRPPANAKLITVAQR